MHDDTINRTCRLPDGSPIPQPVRLRDITYEELMAYDAGIAKGIEFAGTKVPRLDELLAAAEGTNTIIALDKKIGDDEMDGLFAVVEKYKTRVTFSCKDTARIEKVQARFPDALIDYDGDTTEEDLQEVLRFVKPENLQVWMYRDKPNFAWLAPIAKVNPENFRRVKQYGQVGIANIRCTTDVMEALSYAPDAIEL